jgi:hypothetical protein
MMMGASELPYDALEVLHDGGDGQGLDRGGVLAQRFDLNLEARVGGGEHAVAFALVALDPPLPAARGHPQAVDEDDGVGGVWCGHGILLPGNQSLIDNSLNVSALN